MAAIKRYAAVISIALSLVLLGYFLYPALSSFTGSLSDLPIYPGAPQPYSYILDTNTTHYFAFNGTTGYNVLTSTSASTVFQTAFNYANTSHRNTTYYIREGFYNLTTGLTAPMTCGITIQGSGRMTTILHAGATMNAMIETVDNETHFFEIRDLAMEGGVSGNLRATHALLIYNMNCSLATYPYWQHNVIIERVFATYTDGYIFNLTNPVSDNDYSSALIQDCTLRDGKGGIYLDFADSWVTRNYIGALANDTDEDWQAGIYVNRGGNTVVDNYLFGGYKNGITVTSTWNTISNNKIDNMKWNGMVVYGGKYNTMVGNRLSQCSQYANGTYYNLYVTAGADYNLFVGFTIGRRQAHENTTKYGIYEVAGSDYNIYTSFVFEGPFGTAEYSLGGTGSLLNFTQIG